MMPAPRFVLAPRYVLAPRFALAAVVAALALLPGRALAQSGEPMIAVPIAPQGARDRAPLSRDGLRDIVPMPMPELTEDEARRLFRGRLPPRTAPMVRPAPKAPGNVEQKPLKWAGTLAHKVGGTTWGCSAQFIEPRIILTAAHCIVEDNGDQGQISFYLQYDDGDYSKFYPVADGLYWKQWLTAGNDRWRWDYALLCVDKKSKTGNFSFLTDWDDVYDEATAIGYPAAIDKGEVIQVVSGNLTKYEPSVYELAHGVDQFTQGASGGAWVGDFAKKGENEAISVNSFIILNRKGRIYGPYFDDKFSQLLQKLKERPDC